MNLEQLEALVAIAEQGSFRAAGEKLNRSQPALSATIKQLEDEFDIQIFDRSNYRPTLTETGVAFLKVARQTLESAKYTSRVAVELGKHKAETRLCISVDSLISPEVLAVFASECAKPLLPVNLIVTKSILQNSYQPLMEGEIDLAIAPRPPNDENIEAIYLEDVELIGAVSKKLLGGKKKANSAFLKENAQIFFYDRNFDESSEAQVSAGLGSADSIGQKIFVPDHFTKLKLIENGMGWGRISKNELEANPDLVAIDKSTCSPLALELCLLRPKLRAIGPIARNIWKIFEERSAGKAT